MNRGMALSERESGMFAEVFSLMAMRYPELKDKFGMCYVHDHFPMEADEILAEVVDRAGRTLITHPLKLSNISERAFATLWHFGQDGQPVVDQCCHQSCDE